MAYEYHSTNAPYSSGNPDFNDSVGHITPMPAKKGISKWILIGVPVTIAVIIAAVVGGVVGSRNSKSSSSSSSNVVSSGSNSGSDTTVGTGSSDPSQVVSVKQDIGIYATATNSLYELPVYPSTTNTAAFTSPTFVSTTDTSLTWPNDTFAPTDPSPTTVRTDRPRLIAPAYKWQALPTLINNDPYLKAWNDSIFSNATQYYNEAVVTYFMDGSSGILDVAREVKQRIKAFSYVYRMTNDTKWVDRAVQELENAVSTSWGPNDQTKWNPGHFLDTAELTAAFAIAYDWLNEALTDTQKSTVISNMLTYGMEPGLLAYNNSNNEAWGWWTSNTEGNWNCVCNGGLTLGALAILGDDTSGASESLLALTIDNAKNNCVQAVSSDGSWAETPNYWYFGTTGHAEMSASLLSATGSDYGLLTSNENFYKTGLFHMAVTGPGSLFAWGDHGPNKYTATANSILFYGNYYNKPEYVLFQRDAFDARTDPWSMFWYNPAVSGAFWDGLALDNFFDDDLDQWAEMRSSWTDENALYIAIKAGKLQGHQTHNDLDCGDFVLDALGTRWAGEFGSGDYLSADYFSNDTQASDRWLYYRKRTEGQNTILINKANQLVTAAPTVKHDTSGTVQGSSTVFNVPSGSTAYWITNMTSAYADATSVQRGIRMLNNRTQVLLQDEITSSEAIMWLMHTNATVTVDSSGTSATLTIGNRTMKMSILSPTSGATITIQEPAQRFSDDPALPSGQTDQPNPGVTQVMISMDAGTVSLQVLFNPQWDGMSDSDFVTPSSVALDSWSLTSHN